MTRDEQYIPGRLDDGRSLIMREVREVRDEREMDAFPGCAKIIIERKVALEGEQMFAEFTDQARK